MKVRGFEKITKYAAVEFSMPERKTQKSAVAMKMRLLYSKSLYENRLPVFKLFIIVYFCAQNTKKSGNLD